MSCLVKSNYKLCFIENSFAYFTTKEDVRDQWGDDWDDSPYEHNAGLPYIYREGVNEDPWDILSIAFTSPFHIKPCSSGLIDLVSVKDINNGDVPWLRSIHFILPCIYAGASIEDFMKKIEFARGSIYLPKVKGDTMSILTQEKCKICNTNFLSVKWEKLCDDCKYSSKDTLLKQLEEQKIAIENYKKD